MEYSDVIKELKANSSPKNIEGMARFGISSKGTLGVSIPVLRKMAKKTGKDHKLALRLWKSGIHEARLLAGLIDDPLLVSEKQMDDWVCDLDSWDTCDMLCMNLFDKTPFALKKTISWTKDEREFVKRAGFAMMAVLAVHDKKMTDDLFIKYFSLIKKASTDERNFVRKAVNWALRQIGKRNKKLNAKAIIIAKEILKIDSKAARWIANDAIRELTDEKILQRIRL